MACFIGGIFVEDIEYIVKSCLRKAIAKAKLKFYFGGRCMKKKLVPMILAAVILMILKASDVHALCNSQVNDKQLQLANTTRKLLVLLIEFNDIKIKYTDKQWSDRFFNFEGATVNNYFRETTGEKFWYEPVGERYGAVNDGVIKIRLNSNSTIITEDFDSVVQLTYEAMDMAKQYITSSYDTVAAIIAGNNIGGHASWMYSFQSELSGHEGKMVSLHTLCHELGHTLGLPDLYDYDGSSGGVGYTSVMSFEFLGHEGVPYLDAYSMVKLGLVTPTVVKSSGEYKLYSDRKHYNVIKIETPNPNEYFLLENRQFNGYDKALGVFIENGGIAIWHIDESVKRINGRINDNEFHKGVDLEEASERVLGYSHWDRKEYSGYVKYDDFYSINGNFIFNSNSLPSNILYDGTNPKFQVLVTSEPGTEMTIHFINSDSKDTVVGILKNGTEEKARGLAVINGWILSGSRIKNIDGYIDGVYLGKANYGFYEKDINFYAPDYNITHGGFYFNFDTTKHSNGYHDITLVVTDDKGSKTSKTVKFFIDNTTESLSGWSGSLIEDNYGSYPWLKRMYYTLVNGESRYLILADHTIYYSSDSIEWKSASNIKFVSDVIYLNGRFVAVAGDGKIYTSIDGVNWEMRNNYGWSYNFIDIEYGNGRYVVICGDGKIAYSDDGVNWKNANNNTGKIANSLAFGNGRFVAVGDSVLTSTDGINWTKNIDLDYFSSITFGGGKFLAAAGLSSVYLSSDGLNWTKSFIADENLMGDLKAYYGNNEYKILAYNAMYTSKDGVMWTKETFDLNFGYLKDIIYDGNKYVIVSEKFYVIKESNDLVLNSITPKYGYFGYQGEANNYGSITINFNRNIKFPSGSSCLKVVTDKGVQIPVYGYVSGNSLVIRSNYPYYYGTNYKLQVPKEAVEDFYGNKYKHDINFDFLTQYKEELKEDINNDGRVDIKDLAEAARNYNSVPDNNLWNHKLDFNFDYRIDIYDLTRISRRMS
jgi:M6 family metalloprotease-like protein